MDVAPYLLSVRVTGTGFSIFEQPVGYSSLVRIFDRALVAHPRDPLTLQALWIISIILQWVGAVVFKAVDPTGPHICRLESRIGPNVLYTPTQWPINFCLMQMFEWFMSRNCEVSCRVDRGWIERLSPKRLDVRSLCWWMAIRCHLARPTPDLAGPLWFYCTSSSRVIVTCSLPTVQWSLFAMGMSLPLHWCSKHVTQYHAGSALANRFRPWSQVYCPPKILESLGLMEQKRRLSNFEKVNEARRHLSQVIMKIKKSAKNWWVEVAGKVEVATVSGSKDWFNLRIMPVDDEFVSETICDINGEPSHERQQKPHCLAEYFKARFNWPCATLLIAVLTYTNPWEVILNRRNGIRRSEQSTTKADCPDEPRSFFRFLQRRFDTNFYHLVPRHLEEGMYSIDRTTHRLYPFSIRNHAVTVTIIVGSV